MSLLNVGARALLANQLALHTTGHNIANVNNPGYSRQNLVVHTEVSQRWGNGWVGNGVHVATILRNHNELLTRQAAAAQSTQAFDNTRAMRLTQMQDVFRGGSEGLGAGIAQMLDALGHVATSPTDIAARTVVLARMDEIAARMRQSAAQLQDMQQAAHDQLATGVAQVNHLAQSIAALNEEIAHAHHSGHTPNDLLDERDQLIRTLNQHVQTTQRLADDGSMDVFVAGSQALVLGQSAATLTAGESTLFPDSGQQTLRLQRAGSPDIELNVAMLGGGELTALLHFVHHDLAEGRNLLGRMAQALAVSMNAQQRQGITLDGTAGTDLFAVPHSSIGHSKGEALGRVSFNDVARLAASDYEVRFTAPPAGHVVRLSDGKTTAFNDLDDAVLQDIDGLTFTLEAAGKEGERMLFQPLFDAAAQMQLVVHAPRDLAAANPIHAAMGSSNGGTLKLLELKALPSGFSAPPIGSGVTLSFHAGEPLSVTVQGSSTPASGSTMSYIPGQPLVIDGWSITLQGTPHEGDSVTIGNALDPQYGDLWTRDAGNAAALAHLREQPMFDGAPLADGWGQVTAQIGAHTQSALYAAKLSESIASHLEADRSAVSGVNLDEEAARLIQYQQAYQASAKLLQIAQTLFDNLIATTGR